MKISKTRALALLATLALLVTGVFSTISVSAESYLYNGTTNTAMSKATITFLDTDANGYEAPGTNKTQTIQNYNEYRTESNGKGTIDSGRSGYWILLDRYVGLSSDVINSPFSFYPTTSHNYIVADWDVADQRFEITAVYPAGARRALEIPRNGFVLVQYNTLTSGNFFSRLTPGRGIEIQMDDMVATIVARANKNSKVLADYKTYEEFLLRSTQGHKVPSFVENITISTADTYIDASANKDLTGAKLTFHPDVYNGQMYDDWIGLYDHKADMSKIKASGRGLYIPLEKVAGTENTYQIKSGYTVPNYNATTTTVPTSIAEGEYLLCMTFAASSYINYGGANTGNTSNILYMSLKQYFKAGKKFTIDINIDAEPEFETQNVGAVRLLEPAGLRFKTEVNNYGALTKAGYTVEAGTMILPVDYLPADSAEWDTAFTTDVLDAAGTTYLNIERKSWAIDPADHGDKGEMWAAIVNLNEKNYDREFAARAYVTIKMGYESKTFYSDTIAVRSVKAVAQAALADTETTYTATEREVLEKFAG